jgi:hypothetical protein
MTPPASQSRWAAARRELAVAAGLVLALTATAWLLLGAATAGIVALICIALGLAGTRTLIEPYVAPEEPAELVRDFPTQSFTGFWRTQFELSSSTRSLAAWDLNTRGRLQNLLAARLAERHGISLLAEPEAAKQAFIGTGRRADLWYWIDPDRPTPANASSRPGIPPRTLAALIQRLEQL